MKLQDLKSSLDRTHRWEKRSLDEHLKDKKGQAIYAVIHGGVNESLRQKSCKFLEKLEFDGFAIGGSLGKNKKEMMDVLDWTLPHLDDKIPIHLLGIGDLKSLDMCIPVGIDTFDSSYPTRLARHGYILTKEGGYKITKGGLSHSFDSLEKGCSCFSCKNFTKGYLHHLFKAKEITALTLATIHNLHFMLEFVRDLRNKILKDEI